MAAQMNPVQQQLFAADLRESFATVADCAWKAHDAGLGLEATVELVLTTAEELVQSIVRAANR